MAKYLTLILFMTTSFVMSNAYASKELAMIYYNPTSGIQTEDLVYKRVKQDLKSDFLIRDEKVSIERATHNLLAKKGLCVRNLIKTHERRKHYVFSEPMTYFLGLQVYTLPPVAPEIASETTLEGLIAHKRKLVLGVENERSYGDYVDQVLANTPKGISIYTKHGPEDEGQMHSMLMKGRVDIVVEYPAVMAFFNEQANISDQEQPVALSMEGFPPLASGRIACRNTPLGRRFVERVNQSLKVIKSTDAYMDWHLDYVPKSLQHDFLNKLSHELVNS